MEVEYILKKSVARIVRDTRTEKVRKLHNLAPIRKACVVAVLKVQTSTAGVYTTTNLNENANGYY